MTERKGSALFAIFGILVGLAGIIAAAFAGFAYFQDRRGQQSDQDANTTLVAIGNSQATLQSEMVAALSTGNVSNQTLATLQSANQTLEAERNAVFATLTPGYQTPIPNVTSPIASQAPRTDTPIPTEVVISSPIPTTEARAGHEIVVLANSEDNIFKWQGGSPYVTTKFVAEGDVAFIPTGENYFEQELATVGYEKNEVRYITFEIYLIKQDAGLLLQVRTENRDWDHRWGFDGRTNYKGGWGNWPRKGNTLNIPVNTWLTVKLDLIDDLGLRPGQKVLGLAFSGNDGNGVYDRVAFESSGE